MQSVKPVVGDVTIDSHAASAGLRSQDIIVGINGRPVIDRGEAAFRLLDAVSDDGSVALRVQGANGDERDVGISIDDPEQRFEMTKPGKLMRGLGFDFWMPTVPAQIFSVVKGGPADLAGIKPGDTIVSMDGQAGAQLD